MTFQHEDQIHATYSTGTAYEELHQQIPEDKQKLVSLGISKYLQDLEYLLSCSGDTWYEPNLSDHSCLILMYYLGVA